MPDETRSAQLLVRIQPSLKAAAESASHADHRSLSSLVEKLLSDYLTKKGYLGERRARPSSSHRPSGEAGKKAAEMASREIDRVSDQAAPQEERARRKRRLVAGPKEFRDARQK